MTGTDTAATTALRWVREEKPRWDTDKQRVIGGAPDGAFVLPFTDGDELPGEWWSARTDDDRVLGYGRLDVTWGGDAEILLAVDPDTQSQGVGSFLLDRLEQEAAGRDLNYVHNRIREHDQRDFVHDWLVVRGFRGPLEGDLRKRVGAPWQQAAAGESARSAQPYDVSQDPGGQAPGHEEQGGYVSVDEHQY